jgi:hypothetical protein
MTRKETGGQRRRVAAALPLLFALLAYPAARGEAQTEQDMSAIVEAVARMCAMPSEKGYELEYAGSVDAGVIIKLMGVKGEGRLSKNEWEGVQDVLEEERANDRASSRACAQNILPIMMKAYGASGKSTALIRQEYRIQSNFSAKDPVLRAIAFREAFRSQRTFIVDLTPEKAEDEKSARKESHQEGLVNNDIEYYDLESGVFASRGPPPAGFLTGQVSGDTIGFSARSCSGRLVNQPGTWNFRGPVSCGIYKYQGELRLR